MVRLLHPTRFTTKIFEHVQDRRQLTGNEADAPAKAQTPNYVFRNSKKIGIVAKILRRPFAINILAFINTSSIKPCIVATSKLNPNFLQCPQDASRTLFVGHPTAVTRHEDACSGTANSPAVEHVSSFHLCQVPHLFHHTFKLLQFPSTHERNASHSSQQCWSLGCQLHRRNLHLVFFVIMSKVPALFA